MNFSLLSHIFSGKLASMSALSPSLVMILALDKLSGQIFVTDWQFMSCRRGPPNSSQFAAWGDYHNWRLCVRLLELDRTCTKHGYVGTPYPGLMTLETTDQDEWPNFNIWFTREVWRYILFNQFFSKSPFNWRIGTNYFQDHWWRLMTEDFCPNMYLSVSVYKHSIKPIYFTW